MIPISSTTSIVAYEGDGATRDYTFSFPYLDPSHVVTYVDEVVVAHTLTGQQIVRFNTTPANGAYVEIRRQTPSDPIEVIPDGGVITDELLQINEDQARYIAEEARDLAEPALRYSPVLGAYNARNRRIARVASAVDANDAVIKGDVDTAIATAIGGDALGNVVAAANALATQVHADRLDVDDKAAQIAAALGTATSLAATAAAGPSGATICQRITDFLGSDGWTAGSDNPVTTAGKRNRWRFRPRRPMIITGTVGMCEIQFRTTADTPEQATGGTSFTDSQAGGSWISGAALFDNTLTGTGPSTPMLNSTGAASPAKAGYIFATAKAVAQVAIYGHPTDTSSPTLFDVQYSDDGTNYTTAATFTSTGWTPNEQRTFNLPGGIGSHRWWRLLLKASSQPQNAITVQEIQFRSVPGTPEYHTAEANKIFATGVAWTNTAQLFDGTITGQTCQISSTTAQTLDAAPTWAGIYFAAVKDVQEVAITAGMTAGANNGVADFDIDYSDDGSTWVTALSVYNQTTWAANETRTFLMPATPPALGSAEQTFNADGTWTRPTKGRVAFIQCWGAGGGSNGGGGGYTERLVQLVSLPGTVAVTVGLGNAGANGGASSFGSYLSAPGGQAGATTGGNGGGSLGIITPEIGEGHGGYSGVPATGGFHYGGGGTVSGTGGSSVYGGGGGSPTTAGTSLFAGRGGYPSNPPVAPAGGGGPSQAGATGRVVITVW